MSNNRRIGREYALKVLFALQLSKGLEEPESLLTSFLADFRFADDALGEPLAEVEVPLATSSRLFAESLVNGVVELSLIHI